MYRYRYRYMDIIDVRSDTVTKPTPAMRRAMAEAEVGDDVYGEDPTVRELETRVARMAGKEAALFCPSGTMCNLLALLSWCPGRGTEVMVGDQSHIYLYEQAGACQFGGLSLRAVPTQPDGSLRLSDLGRARRPDNDIHEPRTGLLCLESTHNACGGVVLPMAYLQSLRGGGAGGAGGAGHEAAGIAGLPIHMDGARVWHAVAALQVPLAEYLEVVDSATLCLSKGLGAPVGSVLVGPQYLIQNARRLRKALGGGMRQAGVLAAAGLVALDDFEMDAGSLLRIDHLRRGMLASYLSRLTETGTLLRLRPCALPPGVVATNLLYLEVAEGVDAMEVSEILRIHHGIRVCVWDERRLRIAIHRNISAGDMIRLVDALEAVAMSVPVV